MITVTSTTNEKHGNGKYSTLRKRKRVVKKAADSNEFKYLSNNDLTMQFNNSRDPIYFAFEYLEKRTIPQLMSDFVSDSIFEITNFVSKVIPK